MRRVDPSTEVVDFFWHPNTGISGWTTFLYKDTIANNNTVTITEIGSGLYKVAFSTDSTDGALWHLHLYETADTEAAQHSMTYLCSKAHKANLTQINGETENFSRTLSYIRNVVDTLTRKVR